MKKLNLFFFTMVFFACSEFELERANPIENATYVQTYNCESFFNSENERVFNSDCIYWNYTQYLNASWNISSGGYNGSCFSMCDGGLGGWLEYAWSSEFDGHMELWFYISTNPQSPPMLYIDDELVIDGTSIIETTGGPWNKLRTSPIPAGKHDVKFSWGGGHNQKIDEIEIWEYQ